MFVKEVDKTEFRILLQVFRCKIKYVYSVHIKISTRRPTCAQERGFIPNFGLACH